jgi:predicted Fe-Mo cluster-binding NifX family protein
MKVAITSTGNSPGSKLDCHFGRCAYFVIFDTDTKGMEILPNPYKEAKLGAGTDAVKLLASKGAGKIVSGEFGIKIKPLIDSLKIQMIILKDDEKSVQDIINMLHK